MSCRDGLIAQARLEGNTTGPLELITLGVLRLDIGTGLTGSQASQKFTIAISTPIATSSGGTGTTITFTQGSVVFAGSGGVYTEDNANLFWDDSANQLLLGGTSAASADIVLGANGAAIFNEQGSAVDFRVESDANANMLLVSASAETVLVGSATDLTSVLGVHVTTASDKGIVVRAAASQTGNMIQCESSAGVAFFAVDGTTVDQGTIRVAGTGNIIFSRDGRGFSFVATPMTDAFNDNHGIFGKSDGSIELVTLESVLVTHNDPTSPALDLRAYKAGNSGTINSIRIKAHPLSVPLAGFGGRLIFQAGSSTTNYRDLSFIDGVWVDPADATRKGRMIFTTFSVATEVETLRFDPDAVVVNEGGVDMDTRIEGDTATNLFVCDAGLDAVQVGTTTAGVIADFRSASIVLNEDGSDRDLRVEGDNKTSCLLLDASDDEVAIDGRFSLVDTSPAQITANQNDYNPELTATNRATVWRLSSDASRNITGIANGLQGRLLVILNVGSFDIVLTNQDASSLAANRIITGTGTSVTVAADERAILLYDSTTARWRFLV